MTHAMIVMNVLPTTLKDWQIFVNCTHYRWKIYNSFFNDDMMASQQKQYAQRNNHHLQM
jgi:hypothetical protein